MKHIKHEKSEQSVGHALYLQETVTEFVMRAVAFGS